jgi:hypothetical protein
MLGTGFVPTALAAPAATPLAPSHTPFATPLAPSQNVGAGACGGFPSWGIADNPAVGFNNLEENWVANPDAGTGFAPNPVGFNFEVSKLRKYDESEVVGADGGISIAIFLRSCCKLFAILIILILVS